MRGRWNGRRSEEGTIIPPTLGYQSPQPESFPWKWLLRLLLLGPGTGAVVGFAQASAAVACWVLHGQPDFYFRGWAGVRLDFFVMLAGGAAIGIIYGAVLRMFELLTRRRIRLNVVIPVLVAIAFAVAAVFAQWQFQRRKIDWILAPQGIAIALGLALSVLITRPESEASSTRQ